MSRVLRHCYHKGPWPQSRDPSLFQPTPIPVVHSYSASGAALATRADFHRIVLSQARRLPRGIAIDIWPQPSNTRASCLEKQNSSTPRMEPTTNRLNRVQKLNITYHMTNRSMLRAPHDPRPALQINHDIQNILATNLGFSPERRYLAHRTYRCPYTTPFS